MVRPGAPSRLGRLGPQRAVDAHRHARARYLGAAARRGSHASRKVSLSLSCGTWLRALEHVPQGRLKETFRLAKALAKMRTDIALAAKNDLIKEPRRSSPLPGPGCVVVVVFFFPGRLLGLPWLSGTRLGTPGYIFFYQEMIEFPFMKRKLDHLLVKKNISGSS